MLKGMLNSIVDKAKQLSPSMLTPEKRFAKGIIATVSLMTMADGEADSSEIEASSNVIFNHKSVQEFLSADDAKKMYAGQIKLLQDSLSNHGQPGFLLEVNSMIAELASSIVDSSWREEIITVAKAIGASNESGTLGEKEQAILVKIEASFK